MLTGTIEALFKVFKTMEKGFEFFVIVFGLLVASVFLFGMHSLAMFLFIACASLTPLAIKLYYQDYVYPLYILLAIEFFFGFIVFY